MSISTTREVQMSFAVNVAVLQPTDFVRENVVEAICDICSGPVIERGRLTVLKAAGWEISRCGTFCPQHRYET